MRKKIKVKIVELKEKDLEKDLRPLDLIVQKHHGLFSNVGSLAETWRERLPMLKKAYKTGRYGLLVAKETETNTVVAFLDYWIIHCFVENMNIAFLQNMRTIEYARGQGIGSKLVKKLKEICKEKNVEEIHVVAGPGADRFYRKFGFREKDIFMEVRVDDMVV